MRKEEYFNEDFVKKQKTSKKSSKRIHHLDDDDNMLDKFNYYRFPNENRKHKNFV